MSGRKFTYLLTYLSKNCTANINWKDDGKSDEDNYSEENEGVQSDDEEINLVDL